MEVYVWGSGSYGRLGLGHDRDAQKPQRVGGVLNGHEIASGACGWYHSAVVTSTGEAATFGTQVTDCLGNAASDSEPEEACNDEGPDSASETSSGSDALSQSGRRLPTSERPSPGLPRGRRQVQAAVARVESRDCAPSVLRSFPSRVTVIQVAVGGDMLGAHTLAVTRKGQLYSWGYGPACGLGSTGNVSVPTLVTKFLGFGKGEIGSGPAPSSTMEPMYGRHSHHRYRQKASPKLLGLQVMKPRIVKAVCGGSFSAVLSSDGEVFTFGLSASGRLGFRTKFRAQLRPRRIETLTEGSVDVAAGAGFVVLCSATGRLVSWGDNIKGQLGVGHLQESHEPLVLARACPAAFVFQAVAAGDSHALALDSAGHAYSWGGEGGPMTGHGEPTPNRSHVDAAFQLQIRHLPYWWVRPRPIRALNGTRVVHISAGCLHSVAMSHSGALYAWGATLQAGLAPRAQGDQAQVSWIPGLLAPSPRLPLMRVGHAAAGGWHSMACAVVACPMEYLLPDRNGVMDRRFLPLCDGYLWSRVDSLADNEARIYVCCAALRARLASLDGSDSAAWRAFATQLRRLEPEPLESEAARQAEAQSQPQLMQPLRRMDRVEEKDEDNDEGEDCLMEIVALHRGRSRTSTRRKPAPTPRVTTEPEARGPSPSIISDGDEAAGKALPSRLGKKAQPPVFSSDSSESEGNKPAKIPKHAAKIAATPTQPPCTREIPSQAVQPGAKPVGQRRRRPQPPPAFSSDSSSADDSAALPAQSAASGSRQAAASELSPVPRGLPIGLQRGQRPLDLARRSFLPEASPKLDVELCMFSEPVLRALVLFLYTDTLRDVEVIDESHPEYCREQQLREMSLASSPGDAFVDRPALQRSCKGLLLRREVFGLRSIGHALQSERLVCLCNQLLHRIDAPGLPSLFVPASSLRSSMWTLRLQASEQPSRDGPDVRILCGKRVPRAERWGHRQAVRGNQLWAHAFVLLSSCRGIALDDAGDSLAGGMTLRRVSHQSTAIPGVHFELDMRDFEEDLIVAWLRYLYTQEDLCLLWPCNGATRELACFAEGFWTELVRLAQVVGDEQLQLYAQDTLVSALSCENWTQLARFADETQCALLVEAALTTGIRLLHPPLLRAFEVPSGLEGLAREGKGSTRDAASGTSTFGRPGASSGPVDVELEQRLFSLRDHRGYEPSALMDMKRSSPVLFAELTGRLADGVKNAQKAVGQLQHAAEFFDNRQRQRAMGDASGRSTALEVVGLLAVLSVFATPSPLRNKVVDAVLSALGPAWETAKPQAWGLVLAWWPALGSTALQVASLNVAMLAIAAAIMWAGLKN